MTEGGKRPVGGPFEAIDPKLTVFALANGMDLVKSEGSRRLSWYMDGLERGLDVAPAGEGRFSVEARAWKTKTPEDAKTKPVSDAVPVAELPRTLEAAIEDANGL